MRFRVPRSVPGDGEHEAEAACPLQVRSGDADAGPRLESRLSGRPADAAGAGTLRMGKEEEA